MTSSRKVAPIVITIFDVGQASASIIDFGEGRFGVVDCGIDPRFEHNPVLQELEKHARANDQFAIEFVLISHLDTDHFSGLSELLSSQVLSGKIRRLFVNAVEYEGYKAFLRQVPSVGISVTRRSRERLKSLLKIHEWRQEEAACEECVTGPRRDQGWPMELKLGMANSSVRIEVLAPTPRLRARSAASLKRLAESVEKGLPERERLEQEWRDDRNSASVVLRLYAYGRTVLFCGDSTAQTWHSILELLGDEFLGADVVVTWHHGALLGSARGNDYDEAVWNTLGEGRGRERRIAAVSAGAGNQYGHPNVRTIELARKHGFDVWCTQLRIPLGERGVGGSALWHAAVVAFGGGTDAITFVPGERLQCAGDIRVTIVSDGATSIRGSLDASGPADSCDECARRLSGASAR